MKLITTLIFACLYGQASAPAAGWHGFETRSIELPSTGFATLVIPKSPAPCRPWVLQSNLYDGPITGGASAPGLALLEKAGTWWRAR